EELGARAHEARPQGYAGHDREVPDPDVPQSRLALHRGPRFRAQMPDADAGPAGRHAGPSVRRGLGNGDARAEVGAGPLPVEGPQGADPHRGAPGALVPAGAPAGGLINYSSGNKKLKL